MKKIKNTTLLVSGILASCLLVADFITTSQICIYFHRRDSINCTHDVFNTAMIFYIFPFIFLFSLVTYFLKEEIFRIWSKFMYVWLPLSMLLVLIIPGGGGNGAFPSLIDKQLVAILMSSLFVIISFIIVLFGIIKYNILKK